MNKKQLIIIGVGVLLVGGTVGFLYYRKKKGQSQGGFKSNGDASAGYEVDSGGQGTGAVVDERFTTPIDPKLSVVENEDIASYLSGKLSQSEINDLRGWMRLIEKQRKKDPSKWGDANGLTGQASRIGGALYQMKKGGQCSDCWSNDVLTAFLDASA